jgi:hypothetical protein
MILSPGVEEQLPVRCYHVHRATHVPVGHPALRDDREAENVDARFTIADDMNVGWLVIGRIDDEAHSILAQNRNHGSR